MTPTAPRIRFEVVEYFETAGVVRAELISHVGEDSRTNLMKLSSAEAAELRRRLDAHEALVKALNLMFDNYDALVHGHRRSPHSPMEVFEQARAALKLARGES